MGYLAIHHLLFGIVNPIHYVPGFGNHIAEIKEDPYEPKVVDHYVCVLVHFFDMYLLSYFCRVLRVWYRDV